MELYGVVNIDIVKSRDVKNRQGLQKYMGQLINELNHKHASILLAPIAVTLGDECQAVLHKPSQCYNLIHDFQQSFWEYNIDIYGGIGIGELSTAISDDVRMMDGTCFHMAREAINTAKLLPKDRGSISFSKRNRICFNEGKKRIKFSDLWLMNSFDVVRETAAASESGISLMDKEGYSLGDIINTIIENNEILKDKLTSKQKQVYVDYVKYGSYRKILEAYTDKNVGSIGSISQRLNNAEYFTIRRNQEIVEFLLSLYYVLRRHEY